MSRFNATNFVKMYNFLRNISKPGPPDGEPDNSHRANYEAWFKLIYVGCHFKSPKLITAIKYAYDTRCKMWHSLVLLTNAHQLDS
jgi:hypothetical protein